MIFTEPLPFQAALDKLASKGLLPTSLSSAEIRESMDSDLRSRSIFSARTTKASYLQDVKDQVGGMLDGKTNIATVRAKLQDALDRLGYNPREGFGEEDDTEPAEPGSLRDLSSDRRIALVVDTNARQVANWQYREQGQTDQALYSFPCWELVRIYPRRIERGTRLGKGGVVEEDPGNDWPSRWEKAGGDFVGDGRMIARKDDDVWNQLGDSDVFDDALDQPYPPFAFNSGMGVREVPREECIELGVIEDGEEIEGSSRSMNEGIEASADFDPEFLKALKQGLSLAISDGKAKLK
jgi:hypothetical protein